MHILFTTSNYPTSWIIRKLTREDCSHVAIFDKGEVLHSNFLGIQREPIEKFLKHNKILHQVKIEIVTSLEEIHQQYRGYSYDFGALFYSGLRLIFTKLPKANLWQTTGLFLCTEFVTKNIYGEEDSLITPHKLYEKLGE